MRYRLSTNGQNALQTTCSAVKQCDRTIQRLNDVLQTIQRLNNVLHITSRVQVVCYRLFYHVTKSHVTDSTLSVDSVTDGTQEEMEAAIRKRAEQTIPISNTFIHEILVGTGGLPIRVCIEIYTYYFFFYGDILL